MKRDCVSRIGNVARDLLFCMLGACVIGATLYDLRQIVMGW